MYGKSKAPVSRLGFIFAANTLLVAALAITQAAGAQEAGTLYGPEGVSPNAIKQGILGSCYFHASIAALAKVAPETLRNAIGSNPGGGYRVRFSQGPEELVLPEDLAYGRAHSFDRSDGDWVLVLMRGYAQRQVRESLALAIRQSTLIPSYVKPLALGWLEQSDMILIAYDRAIRSVVNQEGVMNKASFRQALAAQLSSLGVPAAEANTFSGLLEEKGFFDSLVTAVSQNGEVFGAYKSLGQGGIPVRVIEAFQGAARAGLVADREPLMQQLRRLRGGRVAFVAGTRGAAPSGDYDHTDWWVVSHAYTVMDYDDGTQTVSLRNPWGRRPEPNGSFTIPLSTFLEAYESYSYTE
jgi:hypothetical protein